MTFQNTTKETMYLVYMLNPEPCEPQHIFSYLTKDEEWDWTGDYNSATGFKTLSRAAEHVNDLKSIKTYEDYVLDICVVQVVLNTVDCVCYNDDLINDQRRRILTKLSDEELEFLHFHGLYPNIDATNSVG